MNMKIIRLPKKFWIMQFSWKGRFVATAFMLVVWWLRQIRWSIISHLKWRKKAWWRLSSRWARLKSWVYWRWTFWGFRTLRLLIMPWGLSEKLTRKKLIFQSCRLMIKKRMSYFSAATRLAYSSWNRREWSDICADWSRLRLKILLLWWLFIVRVQCSLLTVLLGVNTARKK